MSKFNLDRMSKALHKLPNQLHNIKEAIAYTVNPNHRHDEEWEKEVDAARAEICASHRFESFAAERAGNAGRAYIEGHDFYFALSQIIEAAQESIFICGWWISPELHLRRPPLQHPEYRLDRLLQRKAQQGVKIYIIVYKEVNLAMPLASEHTKHALEALHPNISVMRHPDRTGGEIELRFSHHEKIVIVDGVYATIGGLDLCLGRFDTSSHPIADVHPTDLSRTLFLGQSYNNARVRDFHDVTHWVANQVSKLQVARMGWHDVHTMIVGPSVMDVVQHFVERWNFVRGLKYKHDSRFPMLAFPHVTGEDDNPIAAIVRHPHLEAFKKAGKQFLFHAVAPADGGSSPYGGLGKKGDMDIQVLRSSADWSHGVLIEHSIQNAYIQMITEANHCIYMENQFFITSTGTPDDRPVVNKIGMALVNRILSAARSGKRFRVVILLPLIPGFAGSLEGNSATCAIVGETYNSICRGGHSIMEKIAQAGFDPAEYISFFSLRSYDRINHDPERLKRMATESGISYYEVEAAIARLALGDDATEEELERNKSVSFTLGEDGGDHALPPTHEGRSKDGKTIELPLPTFDVAMSQIKKFEAAGVVDESISDSIAHCAFVSAGKVSDEKWSGTAESERLAFVTEELYIHAKLMIVDDRKVIIGSANINERSMDGDRDSEICLVIEDVANLESTMDGRAFMASEFAAGLRRKLWAQHLGLGSPQFCPIEGEELVTPSMKPVGEGEHPTAAQVDPLVTDPMGEGFKLWQSTAKENTRVFSDIFHCVPDDKVHNWAEHRTFLSRESKVGHVHESNTDVTLIKQELDKVRGHLVQFPLEFLKDENLVAFDATVNPLTMSIYV